MEAIFRRAAAMPVMTVAAAAMIDGEGRVLVQRRPWDKAMAGLWEFPGGKVEPGETPEAALVRELDEELGVVVGPEAPEPACFASEPVGDRHLLLLLYIVRAWTGAPEPREATALAWVRPEDLGGLEMPPADVPLIRLLAALL